MKLRHLLSCTAVLAALAATTLAADLRLPRIFGDHMVLQRDKPVRIWGWADKGATVTVEFAGQTTIARVADDGAWQAELKPLALCAEGRTLTATCGSKQVTVKDVLVGDVWIGSGQSNMELDLGGTSRLNNQPDECYYANHPLIRLLEVPGETSDKPQGDIPGAEWKVCTPASAAGFSAVAYYFARDVHKGTGVPIGMIKSARGGTYPESWQTRASLENLKSPIIDKYLADSDKRVADWIANPKGQDPRHGEPGLGLPAGCYNHMIHPIENLAIRGALFYQGENSAVCGGFRTQVYPFAYPAVIRNWRQLFHDPELPFCIIEMAPWGGPGPLTSKDVVDYQSPFVRDVHLQTYLKWPQTGLVVTMDCGKLNDMHPWNKEPVGHRAALWALSQVYHVIPNRGWTGPLYRSMEVKGNKAVIRFHRNGLTLPLGLKDPAGKNNGFIIAGTNRVWQEAQAAIAGETIEVWSDKVPEPAAVRYAWEDCQGLVNLLVNADGLPASPFRTDDWVAKPLFDQPLMLPAEGSRPWADAGPDQTLPAKAASVTLDGRGSYAPGATITRYAWTQLSGPAVKPNGAMTKTLTLDKPAPGQYVFRLTVTDSRKNTASDDVTVKVIDGSLPVADAGKDQTLIYPWLGTVLDGSASHDIFGSLKSYAWTQVSGPTTATLAGTDKVKANVSGLVKGSYVFRLTVTDNLGKKASDDVAVTAQANPIINGGFETGDFTGWTALGNPPAVLQSTNVHSGKYAALIGGGNGWGIHLGVPNVLANLPANMTLSFWVFRHTAAGCMDVRVRGGTGYGDGDPIPCPVPRGGYNDKEWVHCTADLSALAGKSITILAEVLSDDKDTYMFIDDIELLATPKGK